MIGVTIMQDVGKTSAKTVTALAVWRPLVGRFCRLNIKGSLETQSLFRLCPLGFLPLGVDRSVPCGARTDLGDRNPSHQIPPIEIF